MNNHNSPFVVDQVRPVSPDGQSTQTYQLSRASASPSRVIGRDARGLPVEDTLPTVPWRPFLSMDGCINKVPMRTASVPSNHADAVAYENETVSELVSVGFIPAWLCPYSTKFTHLTNGPFAAPPPGVTDCGGSNNEKGCEHLQAIAKVRREEVIRLNNLAEQQFSAKRDEEFNRLREGIVQGVGEAIAKHVGPQSRTERAQKLRDGKGED